MNNTNKEWSILLEACNIALSKNKSAATVVTAPIASIKDINWKMLEQMARYHKIRPLLYKGLQQSPYLSQIPVDFLQVLKHHSFQATTRNLKNTQELLRLLKLFSKKGIEIIPYKGVVLSQQAYQELGIRESSDIDLLIQRKDFKKISAILEQEGYKREYIIPSVLYKLFFKLYCELNFDLHDGDTRLFHVEPHWVLGSKMFQTYIDYKAMHPLTQKEDFFGHKINKLSPEGLLITTVVHHGTAEHWLYLKNITDIAAILKQFEHSLDWPLVLAMCEQLKIINVLLLGLKLSQEFFNSQIPENVSSLLLQKNITTLAAKRKQALPLRVRRPNFTLYFFNRILYQLKLRKAWSTKIKVVYYHLIHFVLRPFLHR